MPKGNKGNKVNQRKIQTSVKQIHGQGDLNKHHQVSMKDVHKKTSKLSEKAREAVGMSAIALVAGNQTLMQLATTQALMEYSKSMPKTGKSSKDNSPVMAVDSRGNPIMLFEPGSVRTIEAPASSRSDRANAASSEASVADAASGMVKEGRVKRKKEKSPQVSATVVASRAEFTEGVTDRSDTEVVKKAYVNAKDLVNIDGSVNKKAVKSIIGPLLNEGRKIVILGKDAKDTLSAPVKEIISAMKKMPFKESVETITYQTRLSKKAALPEFEEVQRDTVYIRLDEIFANGNISEENANKVRNLLEKRHSVVLVGGVGVQTIAKIKKAIGNDELCKKLTSVTKLPNNAFLHSFKEKKVKNSPISRKDLAKMKQEEAIERRVAEQRAAERVVTEPTVPAAVESSATVPPVAGPTTHVPLTPAVTAPVTRVRQVTNEVRSGVVSARAVQEAVKIQTKERPLAETKPQKPKSIIRQMVNFVGGIFADYVINPISNLLSPKKSSKSSQKSTEEDRRVRNYSARKDLKKSSIVGVHAPSRLPKVPEVKRKGQSR